jgi:hypothetical protein
VVDATDTLQQAGLAVMPVRSSATFAQLDVRLDAESTIVDLVADPTPVAEVAQPMTSATSRSWWKPRISSSSTSCAPC